MKNFKTYGLEMVLRIKKKIVASQMTYLSITYEIDHLYVCSANGRIGGPNKTLVAQYFQCPGQYEVCEQGFRRPDACMLGLYVPAKLNKICSIITA